MNEWNVTNGSQTDYQEFGKAQLEVYDSASFGWAYWTLKNDRKHWDFEWNIRNNYLQLGKYSSGFCLASTKCIKCTNLGSESKLLNYFLHLLLQASQFFGIV